MFLIYHYKKVCKYHLTFNILDFVYSHSDMLVRFRLDCEHKRVSRSAPRVFNTNSVQKFGTYIQDPHSAPSIKGKSRSASKKRNINHPTMIDCNLPIGTYSPIKNKLSTSLTSTR